MTSFITVTCKVCGKAFTKEVKDNFWTETPSKRWACPECKKAHKKADKPKRKREYTQEQKEAFKARMEAYRNKKEQNQCEIED